MSEHQNETPNNTPKVTGIGGIFFYTHRIQETKDWYTQHLGIALNDWGSSSFDSRNIDHPDQIDSLQWCPFPASSKHFEPSEKEFMINYRVQHLEALVDQLRANGVTILDDIATYDYGKFVHILDLEGNKIELWEPA